VLAQAIGWILVVSGAVTAVGGLFAAATPRALLRIVFGVSDAGAATLFFARHWGVLIFAVGALLVWAAYDPSLRVAVLAAAALEKLVVVALIFFGPLRRTQLMTVAAVADGTFAVLYLAYLAHL
jgi:hypothetical protein